MQVETYLFTKNRWNNPLNAALDSKNTLIIIFASSKIDKIQKALSDITNIYKNSIIIGASTSGEIFQNELHDDSLSLGVIKFHRTKILHNICQVISQDKSYQSGIEIAKNLQKDNLKAIFILSEGLNVNGSQLTNAISSIVGSNIPVTGGLAADDDKFQQTWIISNGTPQANHICAIGFYGDHIHIKAASKGGWDSIGLKRVVTKSKDNILYELDGKPALEIYKMYLGEKAKDLPASGLLFPLEVKEKDSTEEAKTRTILAINELENSITFAGDIPQNSIVTFMKANFNRLVNGAAEAAEKIDLNQYKEENIVSIAISCVGRRLVLKSKTEEELDAVLEVLPKKTKQIGFYSYGEISPLSSGKCDLHNQTMTLTLIWEEDA